MGSNASVRIVANRPLLRAGLERLAADAEVSVSDDPGRFDVVMRAADDTPTDSAVEVVLAPGSVTVTCWSPPDPIVWEALGRIVLGALSI